MGMIVLNVASSGIASLLLPGLRTAHSIFCIPFQTDETTTCNIKQGSLRENLLICAKIFWDEAPMLNKNCFQALDRTLRDIMRQEDESNMDKPSGGKVVVLGGDFRQILPVIPKGGRQGIVSATINSSDLWKYCKFLKLTKNMRLRTTGSPELATEINEFADWILKIGDGDFESNERGESDIEIPEDLLIQDSENPLLDLVDFAYPNLVQNMKTEKFFEERCILCPTLECVEKVNYFMLDLLPGIPNHKIILKEGALIMVLRNTDHAAGLCNGTQLIVADLGTNVIKVTVIT
ncbi:uncharacterized protein LOC130736832 [Lotus japonicus]|uniref:uncharacterized protein LOC130736832 n=1 Tax=Lotus japonicus TaxID=34305 RepID=UPI002583D381|nr:uncharacterized protein LOC130736832 [Lotus japonicus]